MSIFSQTIERSEKLMKYCVVIMDGNVNIVYGPFDEFAAAEQYAQEWRNFFDAHVTTTTVQVLVIHPVAD